MPQVSNNSNNQHPTLHPTEPYNNFHVMSGINLKTSIVTNHKQSCQGPALVCLVKIWLCLSAWSGSRYFFITFWKTNCLSFRELLLSHLHLWVTKWGLEPPGNKHHWLGPWTWKIHFHIIISVAWGEKLFCSGQFLRPVHKVYKIPYCSWDARVCEYFLL